MSAKLKQRRRAIATSWCRSAEIPEVRKICNKVIGGYDLTPDLQGYADKHPVQISQALAFFGLKFEVVQTENGVAFKKSHRPGGSHQNAVIAACEKLRPSDSPICRNMRTSKATVSARKNGTHTKFYASEEWKRLRYDALVKSNGCCQCCGSSARDGAVLRVDHIKAMSTHWELRSDPDNHQVLCNSCNWGKGSRDSTDWRYGNVQPIRNDGRSMTALEAEEVHS